MSRAVCAHSPAGGARARRRSASTGFTLLELLVTLSVLGVVLVLALNALRFGARSWELERSRTEQTAALRVVQDYLRRQLTLAVPMVVRQGLRDRLAFDGAPQRLGFAAPLGRGERPAGRHWFSLTVDEVAAEPGLVLEYALLDPAAEDLRGVMPQRLVLLPDPGQLRLSYYGRTHPERRARWADAWPGDAELLPTLVRLRLESDDQHVPLEMTVPLQLHAAGAGRRRGG